MKAFRLVIAIAFLCASLAITTRVVGQMVSMEASPGAIIAPGTDVTQVRLYDASLELKIQPVKYKDTAGIAHVTARFELMNLGATDESLAVRLPLSSQSGSGSRILELVVKVNGEQVPISENLYPDPIGKKLEIIWAVFQAEFPSREQVTIEAEYVLPARGEEPYADFDFLFSTAAGWNGTIGKAIFHVTFPYEINTSNLLSISGLTGDVMHSISSSEGNELTWVFHDLEPVQQNDFRIRLVDPTVWIELLEARQAVTDNKEDSASWGRLGELYQKITFNAEGLRPLGAVPDPGLEHLILAGSEAYTRALRLDPLNAEYQLGYARLLGKYAHYYEDWKSNTERQATIQKGVDALKAALVQNPAGKDIQELAAQFAVWFPDYVMVQEERVVFSEVHQPLEPLQTADIGLIDSSDDASLTHKVIPGMVQPDKSRERFLGYGLLALAAGSLGLFIKKVFLDEREIE